MAPSRWRRSSTRQYTSRRWHEASRLVVTLALGGIVWVRRIVPAFAYRTNALAVALELEEKYPVLNDALASAVSFLDAPTAAERGVSNRLQSAAVRSARRLAERHEFRRMIPSGACSRAAWACGLIIASIVPLVLVNIDRSGTALARLADPFGTHPWPTKTRIEILVPSQLPLRMPKGDPFELKFVVRGVIPDRATVTFRIAGGDEFEEGYPLAVGTDPDHSNAANVSAKIDPNRLIGPFAFRIVANDADSGWQSVEVVPPPRLIGLDGRATPQFHVIPPDYTGLSPRELPEGATELQLPTGAIPIGTVVTLRGAADLRLASATLVYLGDKSVVERGAPFAALGNLNPVAAAAAVALSAEIGADIPLPLDPGGRVFMATFQPSMSGTYALKLTDETGLAGTRTIEIPLATDPSPTVSLLRPTPARDAMVLTREATVPIHVAARDAIGDVPLYAVRRVFLQYRVGRGGTIRAIPLTDVRIVERALPAVAGGPVVAIRIRPIAMEEILDLPVTAFQRDDGSPLRDGDTLYLRGAADDWDDVTPAKEPGRSEGEVEIHIASADGIEALLQRELAALRPISCAFAINSGPRGITRSMSHLGRTGLSSPPIATACSVCNINRIKSLARSWTRAMGSPRRPRRSAKPSEPTTCRARTPPTGSSALPAN